MGSREENGHEAGVLLARELGISEEFVLRMVEAFCYFDKVFLLRLTRIDEIKCSLIGG